MSVQTLAYSEDANQNNGGWTSFFSFEPDWMIRMNNKMFSIKNGELYVHNDETVPRNEFYGTQYDSEFVFLLNQEPSTRKRFRTIEVEGSTPLQISLESDYDQGYINTDQFENKEGVYYAYVRVANGAVDTSLLSAQGIGSIGSIAGSTMTFTFDLSEIPLAIGDVVLDSEEMVVGTITGFTGTTITVGALTNVIAGDYVLCAKPQSVENGSMLGYYLQVSASFVSDDAKEVYAVNSEVAKSHQ